MQRFNLNDSVRVDIPHEGDPDFDAYHGRRGEAVKMIHERCVEKVQ